MKRIGYSYITPIVSVLCMCQFGLLLMISDWYSAAATPGKVRKMQSDVQFWTKFGKPSPKHTRFSKTKKKFNQTKKEIMLNIFINDTQNEI
jgi:hypothetical protein